MQNSMQIFPRQPRQTPKIEIPKSDENKLKQLLKLRDPHITIQMKSANLAGADLIEANLSNADLRKADLTNAKLEEADLMGADLENANLEDVDFSNSGLMSANLTGASLVGANLTGASLYGSFLQETLISNTTRFSLLNQLHDNLFITVTVLRDYLSCSKLILEGNSDLEVYLNKLEEKDLNPENFAIQTKELIKTIQETLSEELKILKTGQIMSYADTKPEQITDDPEILSDYGRTLIKAAYLGSSLGRLSHHISSIARKLEDQENPNISSNTPYISQQNYIQLNRFTQQEGSTDISYGIMAGDLFNYQDCKNVDSMTPPPHQNYTEGVLNEHISVWMLKDWEEKEFKKLSQYTPTEQTKILLTQFELIKTEYSDYLEKGDKASPAFNKKSDDYKKTLKNLISEIRSNYQVESIKIKPIGFAKDMYHAYYLTEYNTVIKICVYKSMTEKIRYINKETNQQADLILKEELEATIKKLDQEYFTNIAEINQTNENQLDIETLTKINTPTDLVNWIKSQLIRIDNIELDTDTYFSYTQFTYCYTNYAGLKS